MDSDRFNILVDQIRSKHKGKGFGIKKSQLRAYTVPLNTFSLRKKLRISIDEFEDVFGVSEFMVREWKRGVIKPDKQILLLLHIADKWPEIFLDALEDY